MDSPLVNGRGVGFFHATRGLCQEWLGFSCHERALTRVHSLLLLLHHNENSPSHMLEHKRRSENLPEIRFSKGIKSINHFQFADDTLMLGGASTIMAYQFKKVLDSLLEAFRSQPNSGKYQIYAWNVSLRMKRRIGRIMGFHVGEMLKDFKYLGILICLKMYYPRVW